MKLKITIIITLIALLIMNLSVNGVSTTLDQSTPTISGGPSNNELTVNDTLNLEWQLLNSEESDYEIFMTRDKANTSLVGSGEILMGSVILYLDHLFEGEYEFSFKLIYSSGIEWSNVTITVVGAPKLASELSSDNGFLSGYTLVVGLMVYPLMVWIRLKTKSRR